MILKNMVQLQVLNPTSQTASKFPPHPYSTMETQCPHTAQHPPKRPHKQTLIITNPWPPPMSYNCAFFCGTLLLCQYHLSKEIFTPVFCPMSMGGGTWSNEHNITSFGTTLNIISTLYIRRWYLYPAHSIIVEPCNEVHRSQLKAWELNHNCEWIQILNLIEK